MKRYKFCELLEYEEKIKALFIRCGIQLNNQSRISQYFSYLRLVDEARKKSSEEFHIFLENDKAKYYYSQYYALEIQNIVKALDETNQDISLLKTKLLDLANGTYLLSEENPENTSARNTTFELSLFAFLYNLGIQVKLGEPNPDLQVSTAQFAYDIECKRPSSVNSVEKNIKKAWKQLRKLSVSSRIPTIALSLDKVLINDDLIYHSVGEQIALQGLDNLLHKFMRQSQPMINKIIDSESCVILYYLSCLSGFEDKNLPMANATFMIGNVYNLEGSGIYQDLKKFSGMNLSV